MASLVAQLVKNLPAMRETWVWSLGWEDPLEKGKALCSITPAWRIPCTYSPWGHKVSDTIEHLSLSFFPYVTRMYIETYNRLYVLLANIPDIFKNAEWMHRAGSYSRTRAGVSLVPVSLIWYLLSNDHISTGRFLPKYEESSTIIFVPLSFYSWGLRKSPHLSD